ncbi:sigma-54-dependent Fis family transcriptional regulator [Rhodobacteraceae bacterium NNCM2]|nr:sigma-54-dependent Fis family transcriptional regulator [Coraliihabitans acroporae]
MTKRHVFIVDDDMEMRNSLVDLLETAGWQATAFPRAAEALKHLPALLPDVILSDVRMPGMTGLEMLETLAGADVPPVVLISAHGDIPMAVAAMRSGAYSFVEKPYEPRRLLSILDHAAERHRMNGANQRLRDRLMRLSGLDRVLLGQSPAMARIREEVMDLADSPANILIRGETGTGKELVARALHDLGPNGQGPFAAVNAAALTPQLLANLAAEARKGTLFLDEICVCPMEVQALLLRAIEDREILSPGTGASIPIDFRIFSATNEVVETAVEAGRLRADLLFRLNTVTVTLPLLRDRPDDLALLLRHFMDEHARTYCVSSPEITPEDMAALLAHDWPGNVRELRSVAERRVLAARRGGGSVAQAISPDEEADEIPKTLREAVAAFERQLIAKAIQTHKGRMDAAAEALGIGRRTLNEKIVKLGLDKDALL